VERIRAEDLVGEEWADLLSIADLTRAKKTQRDKDWPMIRRLAEQTYFARAGDHSPARLQFLLSELRTPELLLRLAAENPVEAGELAARVPLFKPRCEAM
jgi:hypothetical protein